MITTRRVLCWLALFVAAIPAFASCAIAAVGYTRVRSLGGIDEYRLDANGLQVLLLPDHSAPVATFQVTFRVGSRNEVTGNTGATHILEHLMFKGSDRFNDSLGNSVKQFVETAGGSYNATTWFDRTNYYATVGKDQLPGYIKIEADRMRHLWLRTTDLDSEMTVVRNEYERNENLPEQVLKKAVFAAAFQAHPYHHSTIGWKSDIEKIDTGKLRAFYDTFYWPNNATITVVGDFDSVGMLALIQNEYGSIPRSPERIPSMSTDEPEQQGPRRAIVKRPGQMGSLLIAFKAASATHPDTPALDVLGSILGTGKNSRLYQALVDSGLASSVTAGPQLSRDPGLFTIAAALTAPDNHEKAEQAVLAAIDRLTREGVTADEVKRAQRQQKVSSVLGRDGSAKTASVLNEWIAAGDWTLYQTYEEAYARVTPTEVQRAALKYLVTDCSTTGWFVPVIPEKKEVHP